MMLTVMYAVYKGIEVIARASQLFFFSLYWILILGFVLIIIAGAVDLRRLQPILEEGWEPIFMLYLHKHYMFHLAK